MNSETIKKDGITLQKRGDRYILQKSFKGVGQKQVAVGKVKKDAFTKAARFLLTAENEGFDKALQELRGKQILRKGEDPTFKQMETLYRDFCANSAKPPRPQTIQLNLDRLSLIMRRAGVTTIGKINKHSIRASWFNGADPTPSQSRTFASAIRAAKSIFKKSALAFYKDHNIDLINPFEGLELVAPKVAQFTPPDLSVVKNIMESAEQELKPNDAMIVLLAFCGLRRSEIEAITPSNFSKQDDKVILNIQETPNFQPKSGQSGFVPIASSTYDKLLKLRGNDSSPFFVPGKSQKKGTSRLWGRVFVVNKWLKSKGLVDKPLHTCRKITGSIIARDHGILEAAKVLRNTPQVCMINYLGVTTVHTVDIENSLKKCS